MKPESVNTRTGGDETGKHESPHSHVPAATPILHLPHDRDRGRERESATAAQNGERILHRPSSPLFQAPSLFADLQTTRDGIDVMQHSIKVSVKRARKAFKIAL